MLVGASLSFVCLGPQSMLISGTVGSLFTDRIDQEQMIAILHRTEQEHGRPTSKVQTEMVHTVWRWDSTPGYLVKQEFLKNDGSIRPR